MRMKSNGFIQDIVSNAYNVILSIHCRPARHTLIFHALIYIVLFASVISHFFYLKGRSRSFHSIFGSDDYNQPPSCQPKELIVTTTSEVSH